MTALSDPLEFGNQLLDIDDLDPVYVLLYGAAYNRTYGMSYTQLQRLCVAYWCYYSLGVAAEISEAKGTAFWRCMEDGLSTYPRGTERRHFRGRVAVKAIQTLAQAFPQPEALVASLRAPESTGISRFKARGAPGGGGEVLPYRICPSSEPAGSKAQGWEVAKPLPFTLVSRRTMALPLFGPWIAFKVCDMLERVLKVPVDFSDCALLSLYSEPRAGAELAGQYWGITPERALARLTAKLSKRQAPPDHARFCNVQEAETVLCKYKSYLHGHYPVGKDLLEVGHSLEHFSCRTSKLLLQVLKENTIYDRMRPKRLV